MKAFPQCDIAAKEVKIFARTSPPDVSYNGLQRRAEMDTLAPGEFVLFTLADHLRTQISISNRNHTYRDAIFVPGFIAGGALTLHISTMTALVRGHTVPNVLNRDTQAMLDSLIQTEREPFFQRLNYLAAKARDNLLLFDGYVDGTFPDVRRQARRTFKNKEMYCKYARLGAHGMLPFLQSMTREGPGL